MVAAFSATLAAIASQYGFTLLGMEMMLLISILALTVGWVFRLKPAVLMSTFAILLYLASSYPELGIMSGFTEKISLLGADLLPWIIMGQIILAQKLRSFILLLTAIITSYIWLGTLTKTMPLTALFGLGFAIAATHYWLGKAWEETGKFGAKLHRTIAWVFALGAALNIQVMWLNIDAVQAKNLWPPSILWLTIFSAAMFVLFLTSLMRYKTSHVSLIGVFIICATVLLIPIAATRPDLIYAAFDTIPGLEAHPGLGLIIGAVIISSGFIWLIDGLKHGRFLDMTLGAIVIGIEALVLFQPARFNVDLGVIFVVSLICALCIGGLITGATPDHNHTPKNFA